MQKVAGPNPVRPTTFSKYKLDSGSFTSTVLLPLLPNNGSNSFEGWVKSKYSKTYAPTVLSYSKRYGYLLGDNSNLSELEQLPSTTKNEAIKALIALSKYQGCYQQFKQRMKSFNLKFARPDSLNAFLRILNASSIAAENSILSYYGSIQQYLRPNERLFTEFLLNSGLRTSEAIESFNLIIKLGSEGRLSDYYNEEWQCLQHFKYKALFIRGTKNTYLTFIRKTFLMRIADSQPLTYTQIRKRLERKGVEMRINEFRDWFGTTLVSNGILEAEQNLVCGRIPVSIFIRHYWSPKLKELGVRIFKALQKPLLC